MPTVKFEKPATDPIVTAVGIASAGCGTLLEGFQYYMVANTNCWVKLGAATPTASAATGSVYVPSNTMVPIRKQGSLDTLAAIRDTADGKICVFRVG